MRDRASQALRFDDLEGRFDAWLIGIALVLAGLGVVMVASSSMPYAMSNGVGPFYYLNRHLVFLALGGVLALTVMRTEIKRIEQHSQIILLLCFAMLLAVLVPGIGKSVNGARRWINLGISNFQVVEAVKLMLIVWLASYLVRFRDEIGNSWKALFKPLIVAGALVGLLLLQPDFGSASLILAITGGMVWLGGARIRNLALPTLAGLAAMSFIVMLEPYRVKRLASFSNPWADAQDSGYQLVQALIAIGRGDLTGVGLGGSILKLDYLPEAHTDFIFSVTAEELGFVGVCCIIGLFALFTWRALRLGLRCIEMRRHFSGYCAFGIGLWISLQAFVSMGVNLGILPTKGLTLPLVSSGGSSVLMTCVAMGLLLRVSYELDRAERQKAKLRAQAPASDAVSDEELYETAPRGAAAAARLGPTTTMPATRGNRARIEPRLGAQR
ncbi:putative lipid II flippase FtsW [Arenimonas oryziterrae]|uniref:putative lipid II flippase FtsW n=1 Tax=Arenimonas oryziterrae TaxID=498055 RepID=UPI00047E95C5|nr:putative lipid II flippase FtsW [Arenimonas oryziterrae]